MIGNKLEPFKFWCQKVLPNVYDDSLSYYEYLCKLNEYLNEVIEQINTLTDNMSDYETDLSQQWLDYKSNLTEQWATYKNYIDNYFNNLNVQTEINNKLDAMAIDGTLSALIEPFIGTDIQTTVTAWLTEHVDPVGSAVTVDNTLTISGSAGDAKVTGDRIAHSLDVTSQLAYLLDEPCANWEIGGYGADGVTPSVSTTRLRSVNFIDITNLAEITCATNYEMFLYLFDDEYTLLGTLTWANSKTNTNKKIR